jgi:hypothetical protein
MRPLLPLLALLAACAPTGGLPGGGANIPGPGEELDDDDAVDDIDSTEVDGWSDNLSALFTLYDDEWLLVIADHGDFCPPLQEETSYDDGDICIDGAGHPSAIYVWGLDQAGGTFDADELSVHGVENAEGSGCDWLGQADAGSITVSGELPNYSGHFDFQFGSVTLAGQFADPDRCTNIPDWG